MLPEIHSHSPSATHIRLGFSVWGGGGGGAGELTHSGACPWDKRILIPVVQIKVLQTDPAELKGSYCVGDTEICSICQWDGCAESRLHLNGISQSAMPCCFTTKYASASAMLPAFACHASACHASAMLAEHDESIISST